MNTPEDEIKDLARNAPLTRPRPGHADLLYQTKYGVRDHRGGGRSSARITAGWVAAGSLAKQFLENPIQNKLPIIITAWVKQIHTIELPKTDQIPSKATIEESLVRCPDIFTSEKMIEAIEKAQGIFTGGGNTFLLVSQLYENNLVETLKKAVLNGTPYLGTSAGSNICGVTMSTTNDMPIVYPP